MQEIKKVSYKIDPNNLPVSLWILLCSICLAIANVVIPNGVFFYVGIFAILLLLLSLTDTIKKKTKIIRRIVKKKNSEGEPTPEEKPQRPKRDIMF